MGGNSRLSRPDDDAPPAGGFGAGPPYGPVGIFARAPPRAPLPIVVVVGLGVLAAIGYVSWLGYQEYRLAEYGQGRALLKELEPLVAQSYYDHGQLCPSAHPLPFSRDSLPAEVEGFRFADDPGWRCLRFVSKRELAFRISYDRLGDDQVELAAANGYARGGVKVRWVVRGHVDTGRKTVAFDEIVEERDLGRDD